MVSQNTKMMDSDLSAERPDAYEVNYYYYYYTFSDGTKPTICPYI